MKLIPDYDDVLTVLSVSQSSPFKDLYVIVDENPGRREHIHSNIRSDNTVDDINEKVAR